MNESTYFYTVKGIRYATTTENDKTIMARVGMTIDNVSKWTNDSDADAAVMRIMAKRQRMPRSWEVDRSF